MKKKIFSLLSIAVVAFHGLSAQEITLDKIYSGQYRAKGISGIASLNDGENYATIEPTGIAKYSYKTSQKEKKYRGRELSGLYFL